MSGGAANPHPLQGHRDEASGPVSTVSSHGYAFRGNDSRLTPDVGRRWLDAHPFGRPALTAELPLRPAAGHERSPDAHGRSFQKALIFFETHPIDPEPPLLVRLRDTLNATILSMWELHQAQKSAERDMLASVARRKDTLRREQGKSDEEEHRRDDGKSHGAFMFEWNR